MPERAKRVFLIEDDDLIREAMTAVLRMKGYSVGTARNGAEALSELRASAELPSVLFVDWSMPVMDGPTFCAARQQDAALREIPVIIMSAHPADIPNTPTGTQGYLRKPFTIESLLAAARPHCS